MYMQIATTRQRRTYVDRMGHLDLTGIGRKTQHVVGRTTRGVFKVNCIKRVLAQSCDPERTPWEPAHGRDTAHSNGTDCSGGRVSSNNSLTKRARCHSKTILHSDRGRKQLHGCVDGCPTKDEWRSHAACNAETGSKERSCPQNAMKIRRRHEESQRRREHRVPL